MNACTLVTSWTLGLGGAGVGGHTVHEQPGRGLCPCISSSYQASSVLGSPRFSCPPGSQGPHVAEVAGMGS